MPNVPRSLFAAVALVWFSTAGCGVDSSDDATTATEGAVSATSATQSFLVLFSGGAIPANADALVTAAGGTIAARYTNVGAVLARSGSASFASSLRATSGVDAVGAVNAVHSSLSPLMVKTGHRPPHNPAPGPGDPLSFRQWDIADQIHAPQAHKISTGSKSVLVGFLDSGVDVTHPDLRRPGQRLCQRLLPGRRRQHLARGLGQRHHRARHVRRRDCRGGQERHRHGGRRPGRQGEHGQGRGRRRQRSQLRAGLPRRRRVRHRLGDRAQRGRAQRQPHDRRSVHRADRRHLLQRSAGPGGYQW